MPALAIGLMACSSGAAPPTAGADMQRASAPPATIYPTPTVAPFAVTTNTPEPVSTQPSYDGRWHESRPGIEYMLTQARVNERDEWLLLTRLDLQRVTLRALYDPDHPQTARDWQQMSRADVVINGGFFDERNRVTGLLIADGLPFGRSYRGFGGMLSVRGDAVNLQWLRTDPYRADATIIQAVQSFPMLVLDGQRVEGISADEDRNRRSFAALDRDGRLILGVTQMAQWTLLDLADFLAASDLDVLSALNLDGGASSGLWLASPTEGVSMNSFEAVPAVIAVYAR